MPKPIPIPPPPQPPQTPRDGHRSSAVPLPSSRRGRGGRPPFATPRNPYTNTAIRWANLPPPSATQPSPHIDGLRRQLHSMPAQSIPLPPSFDTLPTDCCPNPLPPPPPPIDDDGDDMSIDEEPLLTQPPDTPIIPPDAAPIPPPPIPIDSQQFDDDNAAYFPPSENKYPRVPDEATTAITKMFIDVWGIEPRPYQVRAVFYLTFLKLPMTYLIRKTGEGKSMVFLGMSTILRGINVCMVPLIGLGSAQAATSRRHDDNVEAYHLDEFKTRHSFSKLKKYLLNFKPGQRRSLILYVSPQMLQPGTMWHTVLHQLALKGSISSFCVDEVHAAVENSQSFRPEFGDAIQAVRGLIDTSHRLHPHQRVPLLVMSATFRLPEQRLFNKMMQSFPDLVMWGGMDRRNVGLFTKVAGNPLNSLLKDWYSDANDRPDGQSLIMSNSAKACDESIIPKLEIKAESLPSDITDGKDFFSFTGECGLMMKQYLMACFCRSECNESLPFAWAMACTSAAHCGVSSIGCRQCYRLGPAPNFYDLLQEAGRVDRLHNAPPGEQSYRAYLNMTTFLSLWIRVQSEAVSLVRARMLRQLYEVLTFLVLPTQCYHESIEEHFENPDTYQSRGPCDTNCSYCTNDHVNISGRVSRRQVVSALLATLVGAKKPVLANSLVGLFTDKKNNGSIRTAIWGEGTTVDAGKVHGLVLMLIASGILELQVPTCQIGKKNGILPNDVLIRLAVREVHGSDGSANDLVMYDDDVWTKFHLR